MLLLAFFLFPVVLAELQEQTTMKYIIKLDGTTLLSVEATETSSRVLKLSGMGLQDMDCDAFKNVTVVKDIDLGNNSLSSIPNGLFSELVNLEHLNLANNNITKFQKSFEGLSHLKTLNISNNPLTRLGATDLYGLPKSSVVFTKGLSISSINAFVFEKEPGSYEISDPNTYEEFNEETTISYNQNATNKPQEKEVNSNRTENKNGHSGDSAKLGNRKKRYFYNWGPDHHVNICIHDAVLKSVKFVNETETLPNGCQRVVLKSRLYALNLDNMGIARFQKGWYQLDQPVMELTLRNNAIVEVTSELLNDLPASVDYIYLSGNKIERLKSGVIKNEHIKSLRLGNNRISEIETDALADVPSLKYLFLYGNLLNDTKFAASLPINLDILHLGRNRITEISPGSLSRLDRLRDLNLSKNLIQQVNSNSLHGHEMDINLSHNRISSFGEGAFDNTSVEELDVSHNKLSSLKRNFAGGLPPSVQVMHLDFNEIKELEYGTFQNLSVYYLSLTGNKISKIEHGAFDLRSTEITIKMDKNLLNELDVDSFRGLEHLKKLWLADNGITSIPKGFTKILPDLYDLKLSNNPIKRLQNGALYGFRRSGFNVVTLDGVPVEVIEGGLFDDM